MQYFRVFNNEENRKNTIEFIIIYQEKYLNNLDINSINNKCPIKNKNINQIIGLIVKYRYEAKINNKGTDNLINNLEINNNQIINNFINNINNIENKINYNHITIQSNDINNNLDNNFN